MSRSSPSVIALPFAWGGPAVTSLLKQKPEDFQVDEILGFEPDGAGEHVYWQIRKTGISTTRLIDHLSQRLALPRRDISWAGMKDRQAVSTQWVSLRTGQKNEPDPSQVSSDAVSVIDVRRNSRKLRIGSHQGNRFRIVLRQVDGDFEKLKQQAGILATKGVPNYFGSQRFGRHGNNLDTVAALFEGAYKTRNRNERSMLLSAARASGFNQVLAARVRSGCWNRIVTGDVFALEGSRAHFTQDWNNLDEQALAVLESRITEADIHPTGPLWGRGDPEVTGAALELEQLHGLDDKFRRGLESAGVEQDRRALRLMVHDLTIEPAPEGRLMIEFRLPRGGYATTVLRELVAVQSGPDTGEFTE